jgi:hypothetical protein
MNANVQSFDSASTSSINDAVALVGRILLAAIFIKSGFSKITGFEGTVGYIASKGLPLPQIGAILAIIVELGGGILLASRLQGALGGARHRDLHARGRHHLPQLLGGGRGAAHGTGNQLSGRTSR